MEINKESIYFVFNSIQLLEDFTLMLIDNNQGIIYSNQYMVADAGYESEENYLYLEEGHQTYFIK